MKRPVLMLAAGLVLIAVVRGALNGDIRRWYGRTDFAQQRGFTRALEGIARDLEQQQRRPEGTSPNLHIDFNDWGHPLRYAWENGEAVLRGAGRDRILNTKDDFVAVIDIDTKKE